MGHDENACIGDHSCHHYMQLAAANVNYVGCALVENCQIYSETNKFLVCVYSPGLPYEVHRADRIYSEGPTCSKCISPAPFCEEGLCVPCKDSANKCECKKQCHRSQVGYGILKKRSCTCKCLFGIGPNCDEPCSTTTKSSDHEFCKDIPQSACFDSSVRNLLNEYCPYKCPCREFPLTDLTH